MFVVLSMNLKTILVASILVLAFSSCRKEFYCHCEIDFVGLPFPSENVYPIEKNRRQANSECNWIENELEMQYDYSGRVRCRLSNYHWN